MYGEGRNLVATTFVETLADAAIAAAKSPRAAGQAYYIGDPELLEIREFLQTLTKALAIDPPRTGPPFAIAYGMSMLRGKSGPLPEEILRRARSSLFDVQKAISELDFRATITVEEGMKRLARWADELGGADAIVKHARPLPDDSALDREAKAAGA